MTKYEQLLKDIIEDSPAFSLSCKTALNVEKKRTQLLKTFTVEQQESFLQIEDAQLMTLKALGEDPKREGLIGTPFRVAKMLLLETMSGYGQNLAEIADSASFTQCHKGNIVLVKDIDFYSTCEHHIMPFYGKAHVAYLPGEKVLGLSKIPRVVKMAAKKLQLQENLGQEIAEAIQIASKAKAVCVILEAEKHMCVSMRGVEDTSSKTITIATAGPEEGWSINRQEFVATVQNMIK
jgi:GTP cyclohydrolase I